jgi:hypothetical protein
VSDTDYTADRLLAPQAGDRFYLDDGDIRIDNTSSEHVDFVRWRKGEDDYSGTPIRMSLDTWREAVRRYLTRNDQPTMNCPRCGFEMEDFDGVGVVAHVSPMPEACGYCRHPSRDGDGNGNMVCGICGDVSR